MMISVNLEIALFIQFVQFTSAIGDPMVVCVCIEERTSYCV